MVKGEWIVRQDAATGRAIDYGEVVNVTRGQVKVQLFNDSGDYRGEPVWFDRQETTRWTVFPSRRAAMEQWAGSRCDPSE